MIVGPVSGNVTSDDSVLVGLPDFSMSSYYLSLCN